MTKSKIYSISVLIAIAWLLSIQSPAWSKTCTDCGTNAATVGDGIVFDELNVYGAHKPGGPRIAGAWLASGTRVQLQVVGDRLLAQFGKSVFRGPALDGLTIRLEMDDGRAYQLKLERCKPNADLKTHGTKVDPAGKAQSDQTQSDQTKPQAEDLLCGPNLDFWATPSTTAPGYDFSVAKVHNRWNFKAKPKSNEPMVAPVAPCPCSGTRCDSNDDREVNPDRFDHICKGPDLQESTRELEPLRSERYLALAFTGDHYEENHSVTREKSGWFNLACAGTASFKMHLLRHTTAGSAPLPKPTSWSERTAMLRAITADYCSDGRSWTGDGTPLRWTDQRQMFPFKNQPYYDPKVFEDFNVLKQRVEAIWSTKGDLLCVNDPRRTPSKPDPNLPVTYPAVVRASVTSSNAACKNASLIPRCDSFDWTPSHSAPNPWLAHAFTPGQPLSTAYVVTVNWAPNGNYSNINPPGVITWPK